MNSPLPHLREMFLYHFVGERGEFLGNISGTTQIAMRFDTISNLPQ